MSRHTQTEVSMIMKQNLAHGIGELTVVKVRHRVYQYSRLRYMLTLRNGKGD